MARPAAPLPMIAVFKDYRGGAVREDAETGGRDHVTLETPGDRALPTVSAAGMACGLDLRATPRMSACLAEVRRIARSDSRVRCIRRIGRRSLTSAVIEGALSSSADNVAVIDGDLQHDETRLPAMLSALHAGGYG